MTGSTRSSEGLDERRRRLLFRAWRRGTRELDLIMGRFLDETRAGLVAGFGAAHRDIGVRLAHGEASGRRVHHAEHGAVALRRPCDPGGSEGTVFDLDGHVAEGLARDATAPGPGAMKKGTLPGREGALAIPGNDDQTSSRLLVLATPSALSFILAFSA